MARIPSSLLRQTGVIRRTNGRNGLGQPTLGTPIAVRCRLERRRRVLQRPDGQEVVATAAAFVRPDVVVEAEDELMEDTRPLAEVEALIAAQGTAFQADGRTYKIEDVLVAQGLNRPSHKELVLS